MSGRKTVVEGAPLSEQERTAIAEARELLKRYGQDTHPETPDPMTDLGYEQRMCRARALELTTSHGFGKNSDEAIKIADKFYDFIWEGEVPDA